MKKFILSLILATFLIVSPASAEFFRDVIVTSPNGIWTDSRAYTTLNAAITAVGVNERTIKIVSPQTVTILTVPANVTLSFERDGSIANSGQLTINTKNIIAPNRQIFTGTGDIDFAPGSIVKTGWFSTAVEAFDVTNDDELTLIISKSAFITANCAVGDNVSLKWESARNRLTANGGFTLSNIKNIEAGNYQLFAGAGDFDFLDGTELYLKWFARLSSVLTWVENEEVTIIVNEDSVVQADITATSNEGIKVVNGGKLNIDAGVILTLNGPFDAGLYQVFSGNGNISFINSGKISPAWWYTTDWDVAIQKAVDSAGNYKKIDLVGLGSIATDAEISIDESFTGIEGQGRITGTDIAGYVFNFAAAAGTTMAEVKNLDIHANGTTTGALSFDYAAKFVVEGLYITGDDSGVKTGIHISNGCYLGKIDNTRIEGHFTDGILIDDVGIGAGNPNSLQISNTWVHCNNKANSIGIHMNNDVAASLSIRDMYLEDTTLYGFHMEAGRYILMDKVWLDIQAGAAGRIDTDNGIYTNIGGSCTGAANGILVYGNNNYISLTPSWSAYPISGKTVEIQAGASSNTVVTNAMIRVLDNGTNTRIINSTTGELYTGNFNINKGNLSALQVTAGGGSSDKTFNIGSSNDTSVNADRIYQYRLLTEGGATGQDFVVEYIKRGGAWTPLMLFNASENRIEFVYPASDRLVFRDADEDGGDATQFGASTLPINGWIKLFIGNVTHYIPTTETEP